MKRRVHKDTQLESEYWPPVWWYLLIDSEKVCVFFNLYLTLTHRCKGSADCEACQSTVSMERVCSLSSPDSTLSTSSSASAQSSTSPCKHPNRSDQQILTHLHTSVLLTSLWAATQHKTKTSFLIGCPFTACQMMNRRAVVTRWTACRPRTALATATVPSQSDASWLTAIRTASPVLRVWHRRPSPASQRFAPLWCLQWGCRTTTTTTLLS